MLNLKKYFMEMRPNNAGVFQRRVFKRRLKTASGYGACKAFADLTRDQNGQYRAKKPVSN
jgi:hypothetical protein